MTTFAIVVNLVQNIALLLAVSYGFSLLAPRIQHSPSRNIIQGVVFGLFAALGMLTTPPIAPGFIIDGRGIILAMAGYLGGPVSGLITLLIIAATRLSLGGGGVAIALPVAICHMAIGITFYRYEHRINAQLSTRWFLLMGILITISQFILWLLIGGKQGQATVLMTIVPVSILFPLGTWLLGVLIRNQGGQQETIEALEVERAMLRTLIDNVPDYIFIKDKAGRFILSNIAHAHAAQAQNDQDLLGKTANSFFPRELAAQYIEDDQKALQGETILSQERQTVDADGKPIWVTTTKVPMRGKSGEVIGLVGISRDVTKSKLAEDALLKSEEKYRQIIDTATEGIWMIDASRRTTFVNPRMAALLGYHVEEIVGRPLLDFMDEEGRLILNDNIERRRQLAGEDQDYKFLKKDGSSVWAIVSTTPLLDDQDVYVGTLAMITDITDRKHAEIQGFELAAERQRVQVLKRFINDISHDFRTPLTILQTSLFLLRKTATEEQERRISILEIQVARLTTLFDEMVDMYSLEEDETLHVSVYDVNDLIRRVVEQSLPGAENKHQTLEFNAGVDLQPIPLDAPRFEHAISQLIKNGLNFTPENGSITLRTRAEAKQIIIEVQDNGIGIAAEALPHIFDHFYRADRSRSTQTGGSGLGLSIARKIIEAHGGKIDVESTPGQGTMFRIALPIDSPVSELSL